MTVTNDRMVADHGAMSSFSSPSSPFGHAVDSAREIFNTAPLHQLRALAKALCSSSIETHTLVQNSLRTIVELDPTPSAGDTVDNTPEQEKFIKEIHWCSQCNSIYLESRNTVHSCRHHFSKSDVSFFSQDG